MAISRDTSQDCSASNGSTTTLTASFPATATVGKWLISGAGIGTDLAHVTPPAGWSPAVSVEHNSQTFCVLIYYKRSDGTETGATWAVTSGATEIRIGAYQYSGLAASSPLDKTASAQSGVSQVSSIATGTTAATTQANELLFSAVHINDAGTNIAWTSGTELRDDQLFSTSQRIVAATSTYSDTASWTGNIFATAAIATFLAAAEVAVPVVGMY